MNGAEKFDEVMGMIWKRLSEDGMPATEPGWQQNNNSGMLGGIVGSNPANMYRRTYKTLLLTNHLLLSGPERGVDAIRDRSYQLRRLADSYKYVDESGRDQGLNGVFSVLVWIPVHFLICLCGANLISIICRFVQLKISERIFPFNLFT